MIIIIYNLRVENYVPGYINSIELLLRRTLQLQ